MPVVYGAKYSNVPVWVCTVRDVSVMRRRGDGWVNATHLLKVADYDKPRRTRILERDVQTGVHEKVQGGYGKYQGTYIPLERAFALSKQVGILDLVHDLLIYSPQEGEEAEELPRLPKPVGARKSAKNQSDANSSGATGASKPKRARKISSVPGTIDAPPAPRAQPMQSMPPNMNRMYPPQLQWPMYSPQSTYTQSRQQQMTPQQAQQQMNMGMANMPVVPMPGYSMNMSPGGPYNQQSVAGAQHAAYAQVMGDETADHEDTSASAAAALAGQTPESSMYKPAEGGNAVQSTSSSPSLSSSVLSSRSEGFSDDERPYLGGTSFHNQRARNHELTHGVMNEPVVAAMRSSGVVGPANSMSIANGSASSSAGGAGGAGGPDGSGVVTSSGVASNLQSLQGPSQYMAEYSSKLLDYFMSPDKSMIPATLLHPQPGPHINQPIDDEGNTAFHWTCAIGKIELMQALIDAGADIKVLNHAGQTPLARAVMFTNNYEARTFPKVMEMLIETVSVIDPAERTILHHIANTASSSSRSTGARYYAEIILAKLSSSPELLHTSFQTWVDHQDHRGDTALHITCRSDSRRLAKVFLSYNASPAIPNKAGITAEELLRRAKYRKDAGAVAAASGGNDSTYVSSTPTSLTGLKSNGNEEGSRHHGHRHSHTHHNHAQSAAIIAAREASEAIQRYLTEIAKTYDTDLANKDSDISQVRQLLERIRSRVSETDQAIVKLQDEIGSEQQIVMETEKLEQEVREKANQLSQLIERSQARDLAILVQKEESDIQAELKDEVNNSTSGYNETEQMALSRQLSEMQQRRRSLVDEIVVLYGNAGNLEKIGKYRRLLALCCEVPEEEVDGLLDGITQALGTQGS